MEDDEFSEYDESYGSYDSLMGSPYSPYDSCDLDSLDYFPENQTLTLDDQISELPDTVLIHILSFLPTKDAIKTSVLSKKFQSLWALTPTLHFQFDPNPSLQSRHNQIRSFIDSVDQTLILHNAPRLTKFRLDFDYDDIYRPRINLWVRYAVTREVKEIELDFLGDKVIAETYRKPYKLPISLSTFSALTKLSLRYCRFGDRWRRICWDSIKCLSLGYMDLSEGLIRDILLGSPVLEVLELRECSGFNRLDISSHTLQRLEIYGYGDFCKSNADLEISAPWLLSLGVYGSFHRKFRLIDVKPLKDVTLNFRLFDGGGDGDNLYRGYCEFMNELFSRVILAENLTLGTWCIQVLSVQEMIGMDLPGLVPKSLTLDLCFNKWDLPGIKSLLRKSIILEKLVLNMRPRRTSQFSLSKKFIDSYSFDGENYWTSQNLVLACMKNHLKTVKIFGFTGRQFEIELIQFILKKALLLEKMVIWTERAEHLRLKKHSKAEELLELVRKILKFPRASSNAVILFSW